MIKILVPVDFSETSLNALHCAAKLFKSKSLKITVLHTYGAPSSAFHMKSLDRVLKDDADRQMDKLIARIEKEEPEVLFKPVTIKGEAVHAVKSMAESGDYDMIIMGTKGASGLKEVFVGSVAGGVIASTMAPVLVVPSTCQYKTLEKAVVALSDIPLSDSTVMDPLRTIWEATGCEIDVIHIWDEKPSDSDQLIDPVRDMNPVVKLEKSTGDINQQLNSHLAEVNGDILCLIRSKRGFFNRIFQESVTLKQTFDSPVPLLVLHN